MPKRDTMPQVKRFWNEIAPDFDAIYSGSRKGYFARLLDRLFRKDMYQRFDWVMRQAAPVRGKTVCDIGCGSGRFVTQFGKDGAARVVGVDVAPAMLELARKLADQAGVGSICEFVHSDVLDWKVEEQFDITICIGFWDYIADPLPRLRVMRKLTKEQFLSSWPRFWTWRMPLRKVRLSLKGCPVYFFRRPQIYEYLEAAGFHVESCEVIGQLFCVAARPA